MEYPIRILNEGQPKDVQCSIEVLVEGYCRRVDSCLEGFD